MQYVVCLHVARHLGRRAGRWLRPAGKPYLTTLTTAALATALLAGCGSGAGTHQTHPAQPPSTAAQSTAMQVSALLAGIPQRGNVLGDPHAPVTVQYFGDLECPFCRRFTLDTLPLLVERYVRTGKLKLEYRSLETATHARGVFAIQQVAALAAGEQDRLWNFIDLFYHEQHTEDSGYVTESYLQGLAQQIPGLNLVAWTAARAEAGLLDTLTNDARTAAQAGLTGTPSFRIAGPVHVAYYAALHQLLSDQ